jgi:predicted negative regulator of RcsB-dependent stress response
MDKRIKTRWEKSMKALLISLLILLPLLFGFTYWKIATAAAHIGP